MSANRSAAPIADGDSLKAIFAVVWDILGLKNSQFIKMNKVNRTPGCMPGLLGL
jgi:hypothetical protein